ncbi:membrane protein [Nocardia sp. NRRL S-836]|nr:membrane protein [Nocardia sp. NRRL S-836]
MLQELRVAQAGVQILFGFLLSIAFTDKYASVGGYVRVTHLATIMCAAIAVAFLTAPAAWHRVLFRQGRREDIVNSGNTFALIGLGFLAAAMTGTVLLLAEVVVGGWPAVVVGALAFLVFAGLWFALPFASRSAEGADERESA